MSEGSRSEDRRPVTIAPHHMRLRTLAIVTFGLACVPVAADPHLTGAGVAPVTEPSDPDIRELTRRQLALAAAIAPLDSVALDSLIASDVRMINAGDQVFHKTDIVRFLRTNGGAIARVVDDSILVRRYGDVALMTLRESVTIRANGKESTGRLRITEIWFRRGGRWQAVGGQSTALP